jgi:hypothetical protein
MNVTMLKKVRELYNVDYIPYWENRANQRKWIKSVRLLGDKWLLANSRRKNEDASNSVV